MSKKTSTFVSDAAKVVGASPSQGGLAMSFLVPSSVVVDNLKLQNVGLRKEIREVEQAWLDGWMTVHSRDAAIKSALRQIIRNEEKIDDLS